MSKKIQDEIVHKRLCYFNRAGNVWTPYTLAGLTREHIRLMALYEGHVDRIQHKNAIINSLQKDVRRLENG